MCSSISEILLRLLGAVTDISDLQDTVGLLDDRITALETAGPGFVLGSQTGLWVDNTASDGPGIHTDITIPAGFDCNPRIFTSLEGDGYHYMVTGVNAIYNLSPTSFRIYLLNSDGTSPGAANANARHWIIRYTAFEVPCS
jgi:hypothetical protein